MADDPGTGKYFPGVAGKLKAVPKKSTFEINKQQAEEKRRRDATEGHNALRDWERDMRPSTGPRRPDRRPSPPRRHWPEPELPPSLRSSSLDSDGRPKALKTHCYGGEVIYGTVLPAAESLTSSYSPAAIPPELPSANVPYPVSSDDAQPSRPTLQLRNLPPDFSKARVLSELVGPLLEIASVRMVPVHSPACARPSKVAIAICLAQTPTKVVDDVCNKLRGTYLGRGYYLEIHKHSDQRYLSDDPKPLSYEVGDTLAPYPFGAQPVNNCLPAIQMALGVQHHSNGQANQFTVPDHPSFVALPDSNQPVRDIQPTISTIVHPRAPAELWRLKLINWTVENIVAHGLDFEAMLMNDIEVQLDPKWDFIWNPASDGGVWFRWRLYEVATGYDKTKTPLKPDDPPRFHLVYHGKNMPYWVEPFEPHKYSGCAEMYDVREHHDFGWGEEDVSDDDEDYESRKRRRAPEWQRDTYFKPKFLNELQRSKLLWLLRGLPATRAQLLNKQVLSITAFAMEHVEAHSDVVAILIANVIRPFNKRPVIVLPHDSGQGYPPADEDDAKDDAKDGREVDGQGSKKRPLDGDNDTAMSNNPVPDDTGDPSKPPQQVDSSPEKLVALSVITDLLFCSAAVGTTGSQRYPALFCKTVLAMRVFERLGCLGKDEGWGFMRRRAFEERITTLLDRWSLCPGLTKEAVLAMRQQFVGPDRDPNERK